MKFHRILSFCLAAVALPALASAAAPAAGAFHRVDLKPTQSPGKPLPYTLEVPKDWEVRQIEGFPGLWIGPADAKPPKDPRLIWIHGSQASLADPQKLVANIRAADEAKPEWSASRVEIKEVGGVRGLLVRVDIGEGEKASSNLTLKLPLEAASVDFVASNSRAEFDRNLALYERILLSARPVEAAKK